jgi:hypothetical protein
MKPNPQIENWERRRQRDLNSEHMEATLKQPDESRWNPPAIRQWAMRKDLVTMAADLQGAKKFPHSLYFVM